MQTCQNCNISLLSIVPPPDVSPIAGTLLATNLPLEPHEEAIAQQVVAASATRVSHLDEQIDQLDAKVKQLNGMLANLKSRRAEYEDHARLHRNLAVRRLPPDILLEIFRAIICGHPDDIWTVVEVCRLWREVALATPTLWSTFPFKRATETTIVSRLSRSLKYSQSLPFQLTISFDALSYPICPLQVLVSPHARRISHLTVLYPQQLQSTFFFPSTTGQLKWESLSSLNIYHLNACSLQTPPTTAFQHSPLLQDVQVTSVEGTALSFMNELRLPWGQLRKFSAFRITLDCALSILQAATRLEESSIKLAPRRSLVSVFSFSRFRHPLLSRLHISTIDKLMAESFIHAMTLPSLRQLSMDSYNLDLAVISDLVERSSCSLNFLNLPRYYSSIVHPAAGVHRLLSLVPDLSDLCLPLSIEFIQTTLKLVPSLAPRVRHLCLEGTFCKIAIREAASALRDERLACLETFTLHFSRTTQDDPPLTVPHLHRGLHSEFLRQWCSQLQHLVDSLSIVDASCLDNDLDRMLSAIEPHANIPAGYLCEKEGEAVISSLETISTQLPDDLLQHRERISAILLKWSASISIYLNDVGWMRPPSGNSVLVHGHRQGFLHVGTWPRNEDQFASFALQNGYVTV
ncbi:unnamed protein product [Cyclocybe aegerita]|uniref:F-box domain-containing protein n=1 Tax=Cyclocybe aegerita TaxID=1973307 RepID=A0A8S0W0I2_CYCAE|nr:unnamed protein product [Cyclocybe aegerita]